MTPTTLASDFERAMVFVLRWEGSFVDDPADPGGATNKGVTEKVYHQHLAKLGLSTRPVREITDAEVHAIYRADYWDTGHCGQLPWPLCLAHFDACVNAGPKQATKLLQRAVDVKDDGIWGAQTGRAVQHTAIPVAFCRALIERLRFYDALVVKRPTLGKFFRGWTRRTLDLADA